KTERRTSGGSFPTKLLLSLERDWRSRRDPTSSGQKNFELQGANRIQEGAGLLGSCHQLRTMIPAGNVLTRAPKTFAILGTNWSSRSSRKLAKMSCWPSSSLTTMILPDR